VGLSNPVILAETVNDVSVVMLESKQTGMGGWNARAGCSQRMDRGAQTHLE
jgi:hypothetical protein